MIMNIMILFIVKGAIPSQILDTQKRLIESIDFWKSMQQL